MYYEAITLFCTVLVIAMCELLGCVQYVIYTPINTKKLNITQGHPDAGSVRQTFCLNEDLRQVWMTLINA